MYFMESLHHSGSSSNRGGRLLATMLWMIPLLSAALSVACNPFGGNPDPSPDVAAAEQPGSELAPGLAQVGLERIVAAAENLGEANDLEPAAGPDPGSLPPEIPNSAATAVGSDDEARNLVWAYLNQCVSINVDDLEARQIQGEWFVQAAGELPDQYGLWKVDPGLGLVQAHNIRARQWEPLVNQNCTLEQFNEFFTPTPSPLVNPDITEASQAITILWATLVNCYPNMEADDLRATLNPARGEWIVTARTDISANYGVWAVASDGTVSPKNRQAQGVFDQLDSGLC
jgi:hypothetical protein